MTRAAEDSRQAALVELRRQVRPGIRAFCQGIQGFASALGRGAQFFGSEQDLNLHSVTPFCLASFS